MVPSVWATEVQLVTERRWWAVTKWRRQPLFQKDDFTNFPDSSHLGFSVHLLRFRLPEWSAHQIIQERKHVKSPEFILALHNLVMFLNHAYVWFIQTLNGSCISFSCLVHEANTTCRFLLARQAETVVCPTETCWILAHMQMERYQHQNIQRWHFIGLFGDKPLISRVCWCTAWRTMQSNAYMLPCTKKKR